MGLILDTSAVVGWVERDDPAVVAALKELAGSDLPAVHAVTLGELTHGVLLAPDAATASKRRATLEFAREELDVVPFGARDDQPELFGLIAASVSRKVSHNDCWVGAAAAVEQAPLVTQDRRQAEQFSAAVSEGSPLAEWLSTRGRALVVSYCRR